MSWGRFICPCASRLPCAAASSVRRKARGYGRVGTARPCRHWRPRTKRTSPRAPVSATGAWKWLLDSCSARRVIALYRTGTLRSDASTAASSAVVRELLRSGHDVIALARSESAAHKLTGEGALPIAGDISTPQRWLAALPPLDAIIQAAAAFGDDDQMTERRLRGRCDSSTRGDVGCLVPVEKRSRPSRRRSL